MKQERKKVKEKVTRKGKENLEGKKGINLKIGVPDKQNGSFIGRPKRRIGNREKGMKGKVGLSSWGYVCVRVF